MLKGKKFRRFLVMSIIYCSVFSVVFTLGISDNPQFNLYDLFLNLASELIALVITVFVVDTYIKMREEFFREKRANKEAGGFEIARTEGEASVKGTSVVLDKQTGVRYLLVVHEHGSALTPLIEREIAETDGRTAEESAQ